MIDATEVKDPRWSDRLELANGGGVLVRDPESPAEPAPILQVKRRPSHLLAQASGV